MQPLSAGTVLQNRYHIQSVLGQGGFGRTYLAQDGGRFNESCVLKEFMPNSSSDYAVEKSRELFQREAQILYQIQHPQVPQFRAVFEEAERLFLVQDYIEGKTCREVLDQRRPTGQPFTETEVVSLMRQLVPVLRHIHGKGIIHRDITPDNIILRQRDRLPVLIDFGVVKEIVTRVQMADEPPSTTVGKPGYAPIEQVQTGRAYPSSDVYGLAVTALVLLTGKEPQDLFDDLVLAWNWEAIPASPPLMQVLSRMLSYRPGDRYQSVDELSNALAALPLQTTGTSPNAPPSIPPPIPPAPVPPAPPRPQPPASELRTVAVGRPNPTRASSAATPDPARRSTGAGYTVQAPSPQRERSLWHNLGSMLLIAAALAVATA
ncbi:MAG: serine/threonine-protein kinase, partial [Cyanobacteria bacterium P01_A01_bin.135]